MIRHVVFTCPQTGEKADALVARLEAGALAGAPRTNSSISGWESVVPEAALLLVLFNFEGELGFQNGAIPVPDFDPQAAA